MPAYKSAFLKQAIDSILAQSFVDWELVIVDDCSPGNLRGIVSAYDDPRIRYICNEVNIGGADLVAQWNHSISFASGEWLVLAGDDDMYAPDFSAEVMELSNRYPEVDLIRSCVELVDETGAKIWMFNPLQEFMNKEEFFIAWMDARVSDSIGNYVFRREVLQSIGGFLNFSCAFGSDIATPVFLSRNGVANTDRSLFKYRMSEIQLSHNHSKDDEKLEALTQLYTWFFEQDYLKSFQSRLRGKCVYDYFNLVVKYASLRNLTDKLRLCTLARRKEKVMMVLRWIKIRLTSIMSCRDCQ